MFEALFEAFVWAEDRASSNKNACRYYRDNARIGQMPSETQEAV
ncbi:TPA: hypothetical protein ACFU14_001696 [Neisseria cinerea]